MQAVSANPSKSSPVRVAIRQRPTRFEPSVAEKTREDKPAPLDTKVASALLELLSTDNAFRQLFEQDVLAALAQVGHSPAIEAVALRDCVSVGSLLATKMEIAKAREELQRYLTSHTFLTNPHCFDAGEKPSNLRRK